jgi:hypothetical protein
MPTEQILLQRIIRSRRTGAPAAPNLQPGQGLLEVGDEVALVLDADR